MQATESIEDFAESRGIGVGLAGLVVAELWLRSRPPFVPTDDETRVLDRHPGAECRYASYFSKYYAEIWIDCQVASRARTEAKAWSKALAWINDAWMRDETPPVVPQGPPALADTLSKIVDPSASMVPISAKAIEVLRGQKPMSARQVSLALWGTVSKAMAARKVLGKLRADGLVSRAGVKGRVRWRLADGEGLHA